MVVDLPTADLAPAIEGLLPSYATSPGESYDVRFGLHQAEHSWHLETDGRRTEAFASLADAVNAIEHLITLQLLALASDVPQLHAAGAVVDDRAVLAIGESGAGKTSLALRWCLAGLPVLGDDIVLLDEEGRAVPFKRLFNVDPTRLAANDVTPDPTLDWLADPESAYFDPRRGGGWAAPAAVGTVAMVHFAPSHDLEIAELPRARALTLLLASLMPSGKQSDTCFDRMLAIVRDARTVSVVFGDAARAAEALVAPA